MSGSRPGPGRWRAALGRTWAGAPAVVAATAFGVTQPVLDLLGRHPTFFVAQDMGPLAILVFGLVVAVGAPVLALGLIFGAHAVHRRAGVVVRSVVVAATAGAAVAALAGSAGIGSDAVFVVAVLAGAGVVVLADRRWAPARTGFAYLSLSPPAFLALFLFASPTSALLGSQGVATDAGVVVDRPAPVVVLVLDELPLTTLLGTDGLINASRFPRFAELAARSSWYRNATAVADLSHDSIPAMLSGKMPAVGGVPTPHDYPSNLFSVLGGSYETSAVEPVTRLCPATVCVTPGASTAQAVRAAISDAMVVLAHRIAPPGLRDGLPAVDQSWGGFTGSDQDPPDERPDRDQFNAEVWELVTSGAPPAAQYRATQRAIAALDARPATLWFHHVLLPHWPWELTPSGQPYRAAAEGFDHPRWTDDSEAVRRMYQRHAMQVGAADALVGEMIDRLDATGAWDESLVVVASDHGATFRTGHNRREAGVGTLVDNLAVPLFVKYPGQVRGSLDDTNAMLIDVLPTILDVVGVEGDFDFDGRSLVSDPEPARKVFRASGDSHLDSMDSSVEALLDAARAVRQLERGDDDWFGLMAAAAGEGAVVGRSVADLGVGEAVRGSWWGIDGMTTVVVEMDAGPLPVVVDTLVALEAAPRDAPVEVAVAVNGTVAGVGWLEAGDGQRRLVVVLAPPVFADGENTFEAFVVDRGGPHKLRPLRGEAA